MAASASDTNRQNKLLRLLVAATFLIFFQGFMVAPLIPRLATLFQVPVERMGLIEPAYLIPYGLATLVYGPLSDRVGRRPLILGSLVLFILLTALTATVQSASGMITLRLLTGLGASGVVPISLALIGDLFPFQERGRALGWLFGAMAGGMGFGSTAGGVLEPFITWQGLFLGVAALAAVVLVLLLPFRSLLGTRGQGAAPVTMGQLFKAYGSLLGSGRGARTYAYVLFNAIFHAGLYTWLGLYFVRRYGLSPVGIGLALLGYGLPGFLFGPAIGRLADRRGRSRLIPAGLAIGGISAALLALHLPLVAAAVIVTTLSLGYDMTQPLLAGIVTALSPKRGLAMGLNVFCLFTGFGLGSLVFARVLRLGVGTAYLSFGVAALLFGVGAIRLFRSEGRPQANAKTH